jgi:hypothetical protein
VDINEEEYVFMYRDAATQEQCPESSQEAIQPETHSIIENG